MLTFLAALTEARVVRRGAAAAARTATVGMAKIWRGVGWGWIVSFGIGGAKWHRLLHFFWEANAARSKGDRVASSAECVETYLSSHRLQWLAWKGEGCGGK